jgi:hypothetical protein
VVGKGGAPATRSSGPRPQLVPHGSVRSPSKPLGEAAASHGCRLPASARRPPRAAARDARWRRGALDAARRAAARPSGRARGRDRRVLWAGGLHERGAARRGPGPPPRGVGVALRLGAGCAARRGAARHGGARQGRQEGCAGAAGLKGRTLRAMMRPLSSSPRRAPPRAQTPPARPPAAPSRHHDCAVRMGGGGRGAGGRRGAAARSHAARAQQLVRGRRRVMSAVSGAARRGGVDNGEGQAERDDGRASDKDGGGLVLGRLRQIGPTWLWGPLGPLGRRSWGRSSTRGGGGGPGGHGRAAPGGPGRAAEGVGARAPTGLTAFDRRRGVRCRAADVPHARVRFATQRRLKARPALLLPRQIVDRGPPAGARARGGSKAA